MSEWPDEITRAGGAALSKSLRQVIDGTATRGFYESVARQCLDAAVGAGLLEHLLEAQGWEKGGTEERLMQQYPGQRPVRFTSFSVGNLNGGALRAPRVWSETRQRWLGPWRSVVESTGE